MAVPKHRTSKQKKRLRRSHWHLAERNFTNCSHCGQKKVPHIVCKNCGYHQGKPVIILKNKSK